MAVVELIHLDDALEAGDRVITQALGAAVRHAAG